MEEFIKHTELIAALSAEAKSDLMNYLRIKQVKRGDILNRKGNICRHLYFIENGLLKHYYYHQEKQFILRFFCDKRFLTISDCFLKNMPADYSTVALEDTSLIYLEYEHVEKLCARHHSFERFIRVIVSNIAIMCIDRLKTMLQANATERYTNFIDEYGHLQQRISLGDTASFLGMSQVSLSRLRSRK